MWWKLEASFDSFHEKAGQSQDSFGFTSLESLPLGRAASVAILHPQSFMSDFRSLQGGRPQFSRCCNLIIDLGSHLFGGSWARWDEKAGLQRGDGGALQLGESHRRVQAWWIGFGLWTTASGYAGRKSRIGQPMKRAPAKRALIVVRCSRSGGVRFILLDALRFFSFRNLRM